MTSAPKTTATDDGGAGEGPQPLPQVAQLSPYVQGKATLPGRGEAIKLSSNEGCFGPSPLAVAAYHEVAGEMHRYVDGSQYALRLAIAQAHGVDVDRVVCGNGSEELIGLLIRCFLGVDAELLLPENHFVMCPIYAKAQGAKIILVPERNHRIDVDAILQRVTTRTKMVIVANPNNPTGTYITIDEIDRLIAGLPKHVLVLLDGAYAEYVVADDFDAGLRWAEHADNVVMTRTFSKIYGLAGLRIGWAYAPAEILDVVNRLRTPFNASLPAMAAAAASLRDTEHVDRSRTHNREWLDRIAREVADFGFDIVPSVANFYLIDFGERTDKTAADAIRFLEARGIIPRPGAAGNQLRITVGTSPENEAVLEALRAYAAS